ncbi:hypothetical protein KSF_043030 [Reticulibacter mediterranei]|uniref:Uncharacterized protein n=1 Tax=Reticulibacter mediterranei TaxID=2778369 RepID=A0A8J3N3J3_9CHLR|nr:hypothetical protein KSF_043030 [Reticulibacter mediterranei]
MPSSTLVSPLAYFCNTAIESVYNALHNIFRLSREQPHSLSGFQARLAAKVGLHNFCCWLNSFLQRDLMVFADLPDW